MASDWVWPMVPALVNLSPKVMMDPMVTGPWVLHYFLLVFVTQTTPLQRAPLMHLLWLKSLCCHQFPGSQ